MDTELKNLRQKLAYTTKKYETEYNKLIDLSTKRKEMKERETNLQKKETKIILKAKKDHGIDFENPQAMAQKAEDEQYREQYDQLQKKLDILEGAIQSQGRKFKGRCKIQKTKLNAFTDRKKELEHVISM